MWYPAMEALVHPSYRDSSLYSISSYIHRKNYLPLDYLVRPFKALTLFALLRLFPLCQPMLVPPHLHTRTHVLSDFSYCMMCWVNFSSPHPSFIEVSRSVSVWAWQIFCGLRPNFRLFLFLDNAPRSILNWANRYGDPACSYGCLSLLKRLSCKIIRVWGASFLRWRVSWYHHVVYRISEMLDAWRSIA